MSSTIDFAIAAGLFLVSITFLISLVVSYYQSFTGMSLDAELRTVGFNVFNSLFSSKGLPENWEDSQGSVPFRTGLVTDLYKMPIVIQDLSGSVANNITVNFTASFDNNCLNKTWDTSIRIYNESNIEHMFSFYNMSYCRSGSQYVNKTDIVFNVSLPASGKKTFYIFYSGNKNINATNFTSISFPSTAPNVQLTKYPAELTNSVSSSKLTALRNLTYDDLLQTFGSQYIFNLELTDE